MNQRTRRAGHPSKANPHPTRLVVTPDFRLRPTIVGLAFVAMAATAPALHAQTTSSGSVVGASGGGADLTIGDAPGSTGAMSVRNAEFYAGYLQVGVSGTGQLDIGDGTYFRVANTSVVGVNREGRGTVTVEGQNAWLAEDDSMYVGNAGSGSVVVSNGGRLSLDRSPSTDPDLNIGVQAGAPGGSVTVTGKAQSADASRLSVDNDAQVGVAGTGRLEVSDGAQASVSRNVTVGTDAGSDGTLVVSRQSATLGVGSTTTIGDSGTGRASVIDGGRLTTSDLRIGAREGADGEVTVSSPGSSLSASGSLVVGGQGVGRLSVLGGSPVEAANVYVGESAGSVGNVLVSERNDGLRSRLTTDGQLSVAVSGKGTMVVSRGGQADVRQGIVVGNAVGSVGELTVTGSGSRIGTEGDLRIGKSGTASLSVDGGGRVTAAGNASLGIDAGSRSFVSVDGSGSALSVGGKLLIGESGIGEMRVGGGGAVGASSVSLGNDPG
ncbi:MAG TPA: hypothetical protein VMR43_18830, partial [Variovorax sp.]|nr:hypothetical protein [Variovorax sp.]